MAKMAFYRQPRRADAEGVEPPGPFPVATLARWCNQPLCQASKMQEPPRRLRRLFPQTRRVS